MTAYLLFVPVRDSKVEALFDAAVYGTGFWFDRIEIPAPAMTATEIRVRAELQPQIDRLEAHNRGLGTLVLAREAEIDHLAGERDRWRDRAVAAENTLNAARNSAVNPPLPWVVRHIYTKNVHSRYANIGPANITVARLNAEWGWNGAHFEVVEAP